VFIVQLIVLVNYRVTKLTRNSDLHKIFFLEIELFFNICNYFL